MYSRLIICLFLSLSASAFAGENDYDCKGSGLRLILTLDSFGEGIDEVIRGNYKGRAFNYKPATKYKPTPDVFLPSFNTIEGLQTYSYYKDPKANIVVRMTDPTNATYDDPTVDGDLFIDGVKVPFTCWKPGF